MILIDILVLGAGVGVALVLAVVLGLFLLSTVAWFAFGGGE